MSSILEEVRSDLRNIVRVDFYIVVFYSLVLNPAVALVSFILTLALTLLGIAGCISIALIPVGVFIFWCENIVVRILAVVDLVLLTACLRITSLVETPQPFRLGEARNLCFPGTTLSRFVAVTLFNRYMWNAVLYFCFIKPVIAVVNFAVALLFVVGGIACISNIFIYAFCGSQCYSRYEWQHDLPSQSPETEWLMQTYYGSAILVVVGVILLLLSLVVVKRTVAFKASTLVYFLSPQASDFGSIQVTLLHSEHDPLISMNRSHTASFTTLERKYNDM